jgi:hypothetical protein
MKRLANIRGCIAIVLMLGIVVAVASSADASSGQLGVFVRKGLSLERAQAALATQSQVETAELPTKLEKALGASFAGMWYEPNTAKFCIGVVSGASRRAAEQIVAQAGLAGVVSYVSVRSTWAQLISAQNEWNAKLAHLAGQQASTGLTPSDNAVSVTIISSVPERERALLELEAADSHVNVSITVVPPEALKVKPRNSQCEIKPKKAYAFCSKPLAAGVLISNNTRTGYCTAGPLAILPNPSTFAAELETFLITAGHCTKVIKNWFTATHPNNELKEIGPTTTKLLDDLLGDYGAIEVVGEWLEAGATPALAQMTHYEDNGLREAQNVIGEEASVPGASFCKQGATSAEQCGEITEVNAHFTELIKPPDELALVDGLVKTMSCGEGGDSGGPYATLSSGNAVRILGTEVGGPESDKCLEGTLSCSTCTSYYEPIKTSLTGLGLQLLTTANQKRHAGSGPPALKVCKKVPSGEKGLFKNSNCTGNEVTGAFAWAWAGSLTTTVYCVLTAEGRFSDELCENTKGTLAFREKITSELFPLLLGLILRSTFVSKVAGASVQIVCPHGDLIGTPASTTLIEKLQLTYLKCEPVTPKHCEIASKGGTAGTIATGNQIAHLQTLELVVFLAEEANGVYVEIEFKNKGTEECSLNKEVIPIKGTQSCDWEPGLQTPAQDHLLSCTLTGSLLRFGATEAKYEGLAHIHLEGSPFWKIQ